MVKHYYCTECKFGGTRRMVRAHLREEHLINKGNIQKMCNYFYSIDENGNKQTYKKALINDKN